MEIAAHLASRAFRALLRWGPLALVPLDVYAAEQAVLRIDAGGVRFWAATAAVQMLWLSGYAASSLPEWAQWKDTNGGEVAIATRRLKIIQGMVIAGLSGNIAYFGGFYYFGIAEVGCFIAAAVAAYGGDKFLTPVLGRITGRAQQS